MKKKPYYLSNEGMKLVIDTANLICETKGYANRVTKNDAVPIIHALYILQEAMKRRKK